MCVTRQNSLKIYFLMTLAPAATEPPVSRLAGGGCNYKWGGLRRIAPSLALITIYKPYSQSLVMVPRAPKPQNETKLDWNFAHMAPRYGPHHNWTLCILQKIKKHIVVILSLYQGILTIVSISTIKSQPKLWRVLINKLVSAIPQTNNTWKKLRLSACQRL